MVDNVQKLPLGRTLAQHARRKVLEHVQLMSGRAPATLVKATDKTNTIWMVKFDTDGTYTLPQVTVPVHGSEFSRVPYQQGAKGFVAVADMAIAAMTGLGANSAPASFTRGGNLSDLLWHPVGNTNFKPAIDPNAHETYGASSGTITHDGTAKSLVTTHADKGTSVSSGGDGSGAPGPHAMTTSTDGTSIKTPMPHVLDAKNATLNAAGDQTNQGDSTSMGNISTPSGNISAPGGAVTGQSGGFGGGYLGLLKFVGSSISGPPSTGGSLSISPEMVAAGTLQSNAPTTVAALNTAMPPSLAVVGTRTVVTDAVSNTSFNSSDGTTSTPLVMFGTKLVGGGTLQCPAVCVFDGTNYSWVAG